MADIDQAKRDPKSQLWKQLDDSRAVMLGIVGSGQHLQPMAPEVAMDEGTVWFFTKNDTDLVHAVQRGGEAMLSLVSDDEDYHACLTGTMTEVRDEEKIEKFWSPMVAAWFEEGKQDPKLTMLAFRPSKGSIWASTDNALSFGWQIAKANIQDTQPDVGYHTVTDF